MCSIDIRDAVQPGLISLIAYVALLVPYSVLRLLEISGFFVPFQALVFAAVCWFMLGETALATPPDDRSKSLTWS